MRLARAERHALCDTLLAAGPGAATLSGTWTAADLAAHLVIRESARLDLAAGILLRPLSDRTDRATRTMAQDTPFETLVERVRSGPPVWHPARIRQVDEGANLVEMFVHHEDVRRARGGANPRQLDQPMTDALSARLGALAPLMLRGVKDVDVEIVTARTRKRVGKGGRPVVEIHGHPGEQILFLYGRKDVAQVEFVGDDASVAHLSTARLGV